MKEKIKKLDIVIIIGISFVWEGVKKKIEYFIYIL
jgi:hypothetical protein